MTQERVNSRAGQHQLSIIEAGRPDRTIALNNTVTVGRDADNDIVLAAATVSRQHALLLPDAAGMLLIDLKSTNGTLVNGVLAPSDEAVRLADGDVVRFGQQVARYSAPPQDSSDPSRRGSWRTMQREHLTDPRRRRRLAATWMSTAQGLSARWEPGDY